MRGVVQVGCEEEQTGKAKLIDQFHEGKNRAG